MSKQADTIVFTFTPASPDDFLQGVPRRDLTEADLLNLSPVQLYNATVAGPSGKPMYTEVKAAAPAPASKTEKGGDAK